ncbi:UDP-Glycosyltransferase superfamily protein [Striga asiatica]|uniref:UDP-Glycosyltransferase superfamily protein n=1 Tax=Striga asiatica TaxID=4170 RepID=A0A5A7QKR4_STRAF|nr:UDP-Glycosyltransferase superfamily protein [Striga asiatica]
MCLTPMGPLLASSRIGKQRTPSGSVVYVAFGSFAVFNNSSASWRSGFSSRAGCFVGQWEIGLRLRKDESGIIGSEEIKDKLGRVLGDLGFKERAASVAKVLESVLLQEFDENILAQHLNKASSLLEELHTITYEAKTSEAKTQVVYMGKPHAIAIPYPAQGHVLLMLELSQRLAMQHDIKVTVVNTDFNHARVIKSISDSDKLQESVNLISIPDGLEPWEDRNDISRLREGMCQVMLPELEAVINKLNGKNCTEGRGDDKVTCVIADGSMTWALGVADKAGLRKVACWTVSGLAAASLLSIPKLVSDGIIDSHGRIQKHEMVRFAPDSPPIHSTNFIWASFGCKPTFNSRKFHSLLKLADRHICNSSFSLETGVFSAYPNITPLGPLLASTGHRKSLGYFWPPDPASLAWLDRHPTNSVVYVAFGSFTRFGREQFDELALGLELTGRPFLWVVRGDTEETYPDGFMERVGERGLIVRWAPQQQILSHPSVACFVSHCGWNSTVEGVVCGGVPFVCWPYFADQFLNETYICNEWKIGLRLRKDENGIIGRGEIEDKVESVLSHKSYKERALDLQRKTMDGIRGGKSHENLNDFIEWIKRN